ncbi:MAG: bile acid:sodium symporter [Cyanobacteria bacterium HKST-UBA02]|nr:bile acid:sodium symporter [Cyanobacteria bacterium HKST-UBA02]
MSQQNDTAAITFPSPLVPAITSFIHRNFLVILIGAYVLAAVLPQFGLWLRSIEFGRVGWPDGSSLKITASLLMLSFLLFNAGLGIKASELTGLWKNPVPIICGFLANMAVPILLVVTLLSWMNLWHNSDELQNLLVGLAMIISMPIAGSSAAWSQNANGNLSLSLGLVFLSTLLSPITTPLVLHVFCHLTTGDYSSDLHELAQSQGTNAFMLLTVVIPSILGIVAHFILGEKRTALIKPHMKLVNFIALLLLNYSNAATSLPQALRKPDPDFLLFINATTIVLCTAAFLAGWLIARWLKTDQAERASLMFGLGMNNNGTGLVLAASALSDHPAVLLPMIFYTLVQQVLAGLVDWKMFRPEKK